jgi:hypothetical protein
MTNKRQHWEEDTEKNDKENKNNTRGKATTDTGIAKRAKERGVRKDRRSNSRPIYLIAY